MIFLQGLDYRISIEILKVLVLFFKEDVNMAVIGLTFVGLFERENLLYHESVHVIKFHFVF